MRNIPYCIRFKKIRVLCYTLYLALVASLHHMDWLGQWCVLFISLSPYHVYLCTCRAILPAANSSYNKKTN